MPLLWKKRKEDETDRRRGTERNCVDYGKREKERNLSVEGKTIRIEQYKSERNCRIAQRTQLLFFLSLWFFLAFCIRRLFSCGNSCMCRSERLRVMGAQEHTYTSNRINGCYEDNDGRTFAR